MEPYPLKEIKLISFCFGCCENISIDALEAVEFFVRDFLLQLIRTTSKDLCTKKGLTQCILFYLRRNLQMMHKISELVGWAELRNTKVNGEASSIPVVNSEITSR
ncbi:MAG: hypothetical protein EZS28_031642 [Streblomastix strix]|uniref:Uncharacterized protein n=1 Tax=Streblomastix strix TaxID=222440 RepID=A0A5J4US92_9EUKA|nr:MAG: hypothetical protein EZS28_031642 [Streblomastix strix]